MRLFPKDENRRGICGKRPLILKCSIMSIGPGLGDYLSPELETTASKQLADQKLVRRVAEKDEV